MVVLVNDFGALHIGDVCKILIYEGAEFVVKTINGEIVSIPKTMVESYN